MKLNLEVDCGNAAFGEDAQTTAYEVARILRVTAEKMEAGRMSGRCVDYNGNTVGTYELVEEDET